MDNKEPESIKELFLTLKKVLTKIIYRIVEGAGFYFLLYIFAYMTTVTMHSFPPYLFKDVADEQTFQSWMIYVKIGLNYFTLFVFALYVIHVLYSTALDILRRIISDTISFIQWLLDLKKGRKEPSFEKPSKSDHVDDLEGLRGSNGLSSSGQDNDK